MTLCPLGFAEAKAFVVGHHRHHQPPQGHKFSIGAMEGDKLVGVVIVGRPVARGFDNGWTAEITRCCTDGTKNAASMLYAAAWRAARSMGYRRLVTYTLIEEQGTSLRAAGMREVGKTKGGSWDCPARPRTDKAPVGQKTLWEIVGRREKVMG